MNLNFTLNWSKLATLLFLLFSFSFNAFSQGDTCDDAIVITEGSYTVDTLVGMGGIGYGDDADVIAAKWYSYTPSSNALVTISACLGGADTRLWVWTDGCDPEANTLVAENDDFCEFNPGSFAWASEVTFIASAGTEYLINWNDEWTPSGFDFTLSTEPLPVVDVTFNVDMSQVTTAAEGAYIAGSFNGWTGEAMTDNGDDTYTFTLSGVEVGTLIEYKFQNGPGNWEDNFSEDECGLNNNRFVQVELEDITLQTYLYNSCFSAGESCDQPINISEGTYTASELVGTGALTPGATAAKWYAYTPSADTLVTVSACLGGADTRLYVWTDGCDPASNTLVANNDDFCDLGNGNNWASEVSFVGYAGTEYLINFDDFWTNSGFDFTVSNAALPIIDVTVSVDMSTVMTAAEGAYIAGEFNGWTGEPMTDLGNDTYTFTITGVTAGSTVQYKFQNGPGGWEDNFPSEQCGLDNNRFFIAPLESTTLPIVPFNACFYDGEVCINPISVSEGVHVVDTLIGNGSVTGTTSAIWYSYIPSSNGFVNINSCLGGQDTRLFVWTGGCDLANNTLVANNDDFCEFAPGSNSWASQVEFPVEAGTEYLINWDDAYTTSGFEFSVTLIAEPTCAEPVFFIQDSIDQYTPGEIVGQSPDYDFWPADVVTIGGIVTTDQAFSGSQSIAIDVNNDFTDLLLLLNGGNTRTEGHYWLTWKMYIADGKDAYFNLQHEPVTPTFGSWAFDVFFDAGGEGRVELNDGTDPHPFAFTHDEWFDVLLIIDIDNDEARIIIGDLTDNTSLVASWQFSTGVTNGGADYPSSQMHSINFFPITTDGDYQYYIDDIQFAAIPTPEAGDGQYCYTANAIEPGTHTVNNLSCFGAGHFVDDTGLAGQWFTYTPTEDGYVSISSCGGGVDTRGWIFEGECHDLSIIGVSEDHCDLGDGNEWASYKESVVTAGSTYYILWDDIWSPDGFDFELTFTAGDGPDGEFCQTAIPVEVNTDILTENYGSAAVTNGTIWNSSGIAPGLYAGSAWFSFTPEVSDTVDLTACVGDTDTRVWVHTGSCGSLDDLTLIASSDDECGVTAGPSLIEDWVVEAGTTYYIEWDNRFSDETFIWRIEKEVIIDVDEVELNSGISIFPNPARDQLSVQFDLSEATDMEVRLVNTLGQVVDSRILDAVQGETVDFNVSNIAVGTYFVQFITANASSSQKVVITD